MVDVYTKTGDQGSTSLLGGRRVPKSDDRLEAYGTLDELNANVGLLRCQWPPMTPDQAGLSSVGASFTPSPESKRLTQDQGKLLACVQSDLFVLGSRLASESAEMLARLAQLDPQHIVDLEKAIDAMSNHLPVLKNFILPSGSKTVCQAHVCRTVARRAERRIAALAGGNDTPAAQEPSTMMYINRLSDYFFVLARYAAHVAGDADFVWKPNGER